MEKQSIDDSSEIFCSFLFKEGDLNNSDNKLFSKMVIAFADLGKHAPYDVISEIVFDNNDEDYFNELTQSVRQKMDAIIIPENDDELTEKVRKFSSDIVRHVRLSIIQKNYILQESEKASKTASEALEDANKAKENIKIAQEDVDKAKENIKIAQEDVDKVKDDIEDYSEDMKNIKGNIYTDFISILGIFTAITFATFGGLQLLGNVFGQNASRDTHALGSALVLGSIYIYGTYLLLLALLTGIHKLMRVNDTVKVKTKIKDILKDNDYHYSKKLMALISAFCLIMLVVGLLLVIFSK